MFLRRQYRTPTVATASTIATANSTRSVLRTRPPCLSPGTGCSIRRVMLPGQRAGPGLVVCYVRRSLRRTSMKTLALLVPFFVLAAATVAAPSDADYERLERRYVREFLLRHPVVSTYLGGAGLDPTLAAADGAL